MLLSASAAFSDALCAHTQAIRILSGHSSSAPKFPLLHLGMRLSSSFALLFGASLLSSHSLSGALTIGRAKYFFQADSAQSFDSNSFILLAGFSHSAAFPQTLSSIAKQKSQKECVADRSLQNVHWIFSFVRCESSPLSLALNLLVANLVKFAR